MTLVSYMLEESYHIFPRTSTSIKRSTGYVTLRASPIIVAGYAAARHLGGAVPRPLIGSSRV